MTALPNSVKSRFHFSWILHLENMDIFYERALPPEMFSFGTKREPERTAVPGGHESPSGAFKPQTGLRSKCRVFSAARSQRFRRAGSDGLRPPTSASCLGRHSHPAGRCPNSSSLFRPLAALVAVGLGCFCAVFSDVAAAVRIHPRLWPQRSYIRKTPVYFYTSVFLVERSNPNPNHCPLGHLWRRFHRK